MKQQPGNKHHVVVVGGGFGGLRVARRLHGKDVRVTLVDRANYHLFQPLLYQVATTSLTAEEIASPIRSILRPHKDAQVVLGEAVDVDMAARLLALKDGQTLAYDTLVLAAGAETNYYGHDSWRPHLVGLKDLEDAFEVRRRLLTTFEEAEKTPDAEGRARLMTFAVVGGGPTGVEMAGAISELARTILRRDFRRLSQQSLRVLLVEMGPRLLAPFDPKLSKNAADELALLGVEVKCSAKVDDVGPQGLTVDGQLVPASLICWAAGVKPRPIAKQLGTALLPNGLVQVEADCTLPGHPEVFCIGDMAGYVPAPGARPLPGVAPVAMQQGTYVAQTILRRLRGKSPQPFRYFDKGSMATIGTWRAVMQFRGIKMTGSLAWLGWLAVHVFYIIGFRNRLLVLFEWLWSLLARRRGARLITAGRNLSAEANGSERLAGTLPADQAKAQAVAQAPAAPVCTPASS